MRGPIPLPCSRSSYSSGSANRLPTSDRPALTVQQHKESAFSTNSQLWMGTHPNVPSHLASGSSSKTTLASHLQANNDLIGTKVLDKFPDSKEGNLPFLFKVLSIGTALSIQAHPDKKLGERLFEERGDIYKGERERLRLVCAHGWLSW
jgi:mannose-6-phosphate isomerase